MVVFSLTTGALDDEAPFLAASFRAFRSKKLAMIVVSILVVG